MWNVNANILLSCYLSPLVFSTMTNRRVVQLGKIPVENSLRPHIGGFAMQCLSQLQWSILQELG